MLILLILVLLLLGYGGGSYYGRRWYADYEGPGFGIGSVVLILVVLYLLGLFGNGPYIHIGW